jgi:hypothetical protein
LVVLLPLLSTGILTGSGLTSGWAFRQRAQVVARDAAQLQTRSYAMVSTFIVCMALDV